MISREAESPDSVGVAGIFERLGTDADTWQARMQKLNGSRLLARFPEEIGTFSFAASPGAPGLRELSERLGLRQAVNLGACLVT